MERRVLTTTPASQPPRRGLTTGQKLFLAGALVLLAVSVGLRYGWGGSPPSGGGAPPGSSFLDTGGSSAAPAASGLERYLPFVTEGSLFGLIGFALGYATRKVFKLALLVIALLFVGIQLLVSTGHVAIDWMGVNSEFNRLVLNLKHNETLGSFLTNRVPSAATLIAGWVFGFRRG